MITKIQSVLAAATLILASSTGLMAQDWPNEPITLLVPWAAGGGTDPVARLLAEGLTDELGQPVLVDFQPGAGGTVGTAAFLNKPVDGYTLMLTSQTPVVNAMFTTPDLPYDPRDLVPIVTMTNSPTVITANANTPYNDLKEMIDYAIANPGEVNAAISGAGSVTHLAMSLIQFETGAKLNIVPYSGSGAQLADLMSGVVDIGAGFPAGFLPSVASGKLKILGTMGRERLSIVPDVPTTVELGHPDLIVGGWFMVFGQKDLSPEILARVNAATNKILKDPSVRESLEKLGYEVVADSTLESSAALVEEDRKVFNDVFSSGAMDMSLGQ
jgi:tripartite-type tricarboxylate transporter receptor subunit TctC